MAPRRDDPHAKISIPEAKRAIYIDVEKLVKEPPALLGILIDDVLEQVVLDPGLQLAATAKGHRFSSFKAEAQNIVKKSKDERRPIVAFTRHELNLFDEYANIDITILYRDARKFAKYWKNKCHYNEPIEGWELKAFLKFIKYPRSKNLGLRKSTKRIREVREMLERRGSFDALTAVKKAHWTNLLKHNAIDCQGMKALVIKAARELRSRQT